MSNNIAPITSLIDATVIGLIDSTLILIAKNADPHIADKSISKIKLLIDEFLNRL